MIHSGVVVPVDDNDDDNNNSVNLRGAHAHGEKQRWEGANHRVTYTAWRLTSVTITSISVIPVY